jgi:hypothetical protein
MKLTDSEREEFIALTANTYDPELFTEDDLPLLRGAKRQWEEEQARKSAVLTADQPPIADEEDYGAEPRAELHER